MVIVIVALAEELLASVWLVVISLSGILLLASEALVSDPTNIGKPASITTRAIKGIILFTFTFSLSLYALFVSNRRLPKYSHFDGFIQFFQPLKKAEVRVEKYYKFCTKTETETSDYEGFMEFLEPIKKGK